ncbi:hypothetical protein PIB30_062645 [Stylosanthes scabra]|uniref:Uncharacterized protein n=1 Tax=Stylosanthes scabra TaxID=79078 RepID=A0ABU6XJ33_9FABA|nr:hypothetical protein [Stylosanthes scabra]
MIRQDWWRLQARFHGEGSGSGDDSSCRAADMAESGLLPVREIEKERNRSRDTEGRGLPTATGWTADTAAGVLLSLLGGGGDFPSRRRRQRRTASPENSFVVLPCQRRRRSSSRVWVVAVWMGAALGLEEGVGGERAASGLQMKGGLCSTKDILKFSSALPSDKSDGMLFQWQCPPGARAVSTDSLSSACLDASAEPDTSCTRTPFTDARHYRSLFSRRRVAPPTPPHHLSPPPSDDEPFEGAYDPAADLEGDPEESYPGPIDYPAAHDAYSSDASHGSERVSVSAGSAPSSRHSSDDSSASGSLGYDEASRGSVNSCASDDDLVNRYFAGTFP